MKKYYLIKFNDLSDAKKNEIKADLYEEFVNDNEQYPQTIELMIDDMCDKSWCELEVSDESEVIING
jgi:hypothetical protein